MEYPLGDDVSVFIYEGVGCGRTVVSVGLFSVPRSVTVARGDVVVTGTFDTKTKGTLL